MTRKIYDITMDLSEKTAAWPGSEKFRLKWLKKYKSGYSESAVAMSSHAGTHVDAPRHFLKDGATIKGVSLERLVGKALVVEFGGRGEIGEDFLSTIRVPRGCKKLLFKTRNSRFVAKDGSFRKDYVALGLTGAEWVVKKEMDLVGIDYLSIENFAAREKNVHKLLLGAEVAVLEGICLEGVPCGVYELVALPLKASGAEGAPARAILIKR